MAVIDETRGVLVVRVVYDGPALSGKTSSLRALARGVGSEMSTPAETAGRTLFFDWVDYVGGLFDGRQIRCQIVSVPGQLELAKRRELLLATADVVVLVLDTRQGEWQFSLDWIKRTIPTCRAKDPPVGLVLQANKRDAPDAVPTETMREALARIAPVALVPSTATTGEGIREAFVLAVRLALDRVRSLAGSGRLASGKPDEDSPEQLLEKLQQAEKQPDAALSDDMQSSVFKALSFEHEVFARPSSRPPAEPLEGSDEALFIPDPMMPGGMIWPPVDGRALLHEVSTLGIRPKRTARDDWAGSGSGFRFHSLSNAVFADLHSARNELIEWARLHSANTAHLSGGRAVILADAGAGRLRLWQIVRAEASLRERLSAALPVSDSSQVARELLSVAMQLAAAREYFSSTTLALPCTLWTVGANTTSRPTFVGLMPSREGRLKTEPTGRELLLREMSPQLRELRRTRVDYADVVARLTALSELSGRGTPAGWLAEIVLET
jgi:signal recognition particle receptor subunit beta